ncbi:uncharacterized protein LOC106672044 [Cimex lectularius]|uniref:DRBM domain-containing protein n=1 Tax=Cimex lectularius TaxID=79782 RepID=A0A8I6S835_CIMLE|nr:uncharacterized protein LOC106672044 [Cimex lectularius]
MEVPKLSPDASLGMMELDVPIDVDDDVKLLNPNESPLKILSELFRGEGPIYKFSSFDKYGMKVFVCTVTVRNKVTGVGKYYNKKIAKYHAAVNALKKLGFKVDFDINVEPDQMAIDDVPKHEPTAKNQIACYKDIDCDVKNLVPIKMEPLDDLTESDELFKSCKKARFELRNIDDIGQPLMKRIENRTNNLAFLWYDYEIFDKSKRYRLRTSGSNMLENPIGYINERCTKHQVPWPVYTVMNLPSSKPHIFKASISLGGLRFTGTARSKRCAKWCAARQLVEFVCQTFGADWFGDSDDEYEELDSILGIGKSNKLSLM